MNSRCSCQLPGRWNSAFAEHRTAGHDLPLDDEPWIARQVSLWLQTIFTIAHEVQWLFHN